jgi:GNAT superfamily N-acetyltransferase
VIVNMIVDLADASFETPDEATTLAAAGVNLIEREGASADDVEWIQRTFHGRWHEESAAGWNWFARGALETVGFAAYGQHSIRFWWLDAWWDRADVGIFGPMGVDRKMRGLHVGVVLARRALGSLKEMGFAHALIPAVGPIEFYEKHCGARVVERLPHRS